MRVAYVDGIAGLPTISTILVLVIVTAVVTFVWSEKLAIPNLMSALLLTVVSPLAMLVYKLINEPYIATDEIIWHSLGKQAGAFMLGEVPRAPEYADGKEGYIWILGGLYAAGGPAPLIAVTLNICLAVLTGLALAHSVKLIIQLRGCATAKASRSANVAVVVFALSPATIFWTPSLVREGINLFVFAVVMLALLCLISREATLLPLCVIIAATSLLLWVRLDVGLMLTASILLWVLWSSVGTSILRTVWRLCLVLVSTLLVLGNWGVISSVLGASTDEFNARTSYLANTASSGFSGFSNNSNILEILMVSAPRVLAGPFVWEMDTSPVMLLALSSGLLWLVTAGLAIVGIFRVLPPEVTRHYGTLVCSMLCVYLFGLMLSLGNYGILTRFRQVAIVIALPVAAVIWDELMERYRRPSKVLGFGEAPVSTVGGSKPGPRRGKLGDSRPTRARASETASRALSSNV